jgi:hypothetical protein
MNFPYTQVAFTRAMLFLVATYVESEGLPSVPARAGKQKLSLLKGLSVLLRSHQQADGLRIKYIAAREPKSLITNPRFLIPNPQFLIPTPYSPIPIPMPSTNEPRVRCNTAPVVPFSSIRVDGAIHVTRKAPGVFDDWTFTT